MRGKLAAPPCPPFLIKLSSAACVTMSPLSWRRSKPAEINSSCQGAVRKRNKATRRMVNRRGGQVSPGSALIGRETKRRAQTTCRTAEPVARVAFDSGGNIAEIVFHCICTGFYTQPAFIQTRLPLIISQNNLSIIYSGEEKSKHDLLAVSVCSCF